MFRNRKSEYLDKCMSQLLFNNTSQFQTNRTIKGISEGQFLSCQTNISDGNHSEFFMSTPLKKTFKIEKQNNINHQKKDEIKKDNITTSHQSRRSDSRLTLNRKKGINQRKINMSQKQNKKCYDIKIQRNSSLITPFGLNKQYLNRNERCKPVNRTQQKYSPTNATVRQAVMHKLQKIAQKKRHHYQSQSDITAINIIPKLKKLQNKQLCWKRKQKNSIKRLLNYQDMIDCDSQSSENVMNMKIKQKMEELGIKALDQSFQMVQYDEMQPLVEFLVTQHSSKTNQNTKNTEISNIHICRKDSDLIPNDKSRILSEQQQNNIFIVEESIIIPAAKQLQQQLNKMINDSLDNIESDKIAKFLNKIQNQTLKEVLQNLIESKQLPYSLTQFQRESALVATQLLSKIQSFKQIYSTNLINPFKKLNDNYSSFWLVAAILYLLQKLRNNQIELLDEKDIYDSILSDTFSEIKSSDQRFSIQHFIRDLVKQLKEVNSLTFDSNLTPQALCKDFLKHQFIVRNRKQQF